MPERSSQRLDEAAKIFEKALPLSDGDRSVYVDAACGDDGELRDLVKELLRAQARQGEFLARPTGIDRAGAARPPAGGGPPEDGAPPGGGEPEHSGESAPIAEGPGTTIGPYKLLQQVGEGGFGVVFMAEQQHPVQRRVALKVIKLGMDTRQVVARFEQERQALALMDHPNIARVLDAGSTGTGRPYFVMELVRGVPITEYCDAASLSARGRLELFVPVCRAIQHAHQKGIIHRDIKPTNILVTLHDGKPVPKIIDFGIAKATDRRLTEKTLFTELRAMVGTPAYMSPEQAEMSGLDVDTRSDVYSLGVLLYELLTGTTPFSQEELYSAGFAEMQRMIREVDPPKPSTRVSTLGERLVAVAARREIEPRRLGLLLKGDLDWVIMKSIEKDRSRRYDTATALAEDVERHLVGEPVEAAPPSRAYRLRKFASRNKGAVAAGMTGALLLVLAVFLTSRGWRVARSREDQLRTALGVSEVRRSESERARRELQHESYATSIFTARALLESGDYRKARETLAACPVAERGLEWNYLESEARGTLFALPGRTRAWSSTGGDVILSGPRLFDGATGRELLEVEAQAFHGSRLSPDGSAILTLEPGSAVLWDRHEARRLLSFGYMSEAVFTDDRRLVVAHGARASVWDLPGLRRMFDLPRKADYAAVSAGGGRIATWHTPEVEGVQIWDRNGELVSELRGHTDWLSRVGFAGRGDLVLTAGQDWTARVWDAESGALLDVMAHPGPVYSAALDPLEERLVTAAADGAIRVWNLGDGGDAASPALLVPGLDSASATFVDDGKLVMASSLEGTVTFIDPQDGTLLRELRGHVIDEIAHATLGVEGDRILLRGLGYTAEANEVLSRSGSVGARHRRSSLSSGHGLEARFSPTGARALVQSPDGSVQLIEPATGRAVARLEAPIVMRRCAFSADGSRLALRVHDQMRRADRTLLFDAMSGEPLPAPLPHHPGHDAGRYLGNGPACFSGDGSQLAVIDRGCEVRVIASMDGTLTKVLQQSTDEPAQFDLNRVWFSPRDRCVVAVNRAWFGFVWSLDSEDTLPVGRVEPALPGVGFVAFSPGDRLFVTSAESELDVRRTSDGDVTCRLQARLVSIVAAHFSPDGATLVTEQLKGPVRLWRLEEGGVELRLSEGCEAFATSIGLSVGGNVAAFGTADGEMLVRNMWSGEQVQLAGEAVASSFLCFSDDGGLVATHDGNGGVRVWSTIADGESAAGNQVASWENAERGGVARGAFRGDGSLAVFWGREGKLLTPDGSVALPRPPSDTPQFDVQFDESGANVLAVADGQVVAAWSADGPESLPAGRSGADSALATFFSPDLAHAVVREPDGRVSVQAGLSGRRVGSLWTPVAIEPVGAASADQRVLLSATRKDHRADLWDAWTHTRLGRLAEHTAGVRSVGISADGSRGITGSDDHTAIVWDLERGEVLWKLPHNASLGAVALDPEGSRALTGSDDHGGGLWDTRDGTRIVATSGHRSEIVHVAFSPDGAVALTLSADSVRLWNAADGAALRVYEEPASFRAAVFDPRGERVAVVARNASVQVHDVRTGSLLATYSASSPIECAVFTTDGTGLLFGTEAGTIVSLDVATGRTDIRHAHDDAVIRIALTSNGSRFVSASRDRSVRIWDPQRPDPLLSLPETPHPFRQLWVSPDDRRILTLTERGWLESWDTKPRAQPVEPLRRPGD